jgi:hypothetical protein
MKSEADEPEAVSEAEFSLSSDDSVAALPANRSQSGEDQHPSARLRHFASSAFAGAAGISFSFIVGRGLRTASAVFLLTNTANAGQQRRRNRNPRSIAERVKQPQRRSRSESHQRWTVQRGFERNRGPCNRRAHRGSNWLVELCRWRLRRGSCLLRHFFHAIPAARARGNLAIGDQGFACFERNSMPTPENSVSNSIRNKNQTRPIHLLDLGMIEIESRVVSLNDWVMFRCPFQFATVPYSAWHDRIWIHRTSLHLAQRLLLREQENVLARCDSLTAWPHRFGCLEERWNLRRDEGKPNRETHAEYSQQDPSNLSIATMATRAAPPDHPLDTPHFRFTRQLLPTFATGLLGLAR